MLSVDQIYQPGFSADPAQLLRKSRRVRDLRLTVPKDYADALGLGENRKLDNLLRFEDFIKEENQKDRKKPFNKVKSVKDYMKIREDYIHSFIAQHERDYEPEEE